MKKGSSPSSTSVPSSGPSDIRVSGGREKIKLAVAASPATQSRAAFDSGMSLRFTLWRLAYENPQSAKPAAPRETNGNAGLQKLSMFKRIARGATQCSQLTLRGAYRQVKFSTAKVSSSEQVVIAKANFQ